MANVRLLRQQVQDYQRKLEGINRGYRAEYRGYKGEVDTYNAVAESRNKAIAEAEANGSRVAEPISGGKYRVLTPAGDGRVAPLVKTLTKDVGDYVFMDNGAGALTMYRLQPVSYNAKGYVAVGTVGKVAALPPMPKAPDEPDAPEGPNFTEKEKGLLKNPTATPAEMVMANAKGVGAQSSLSGDEPAAPTSAFANPDDPNNLKERGVLARVLGGKL